jgi:selenocysteine-specific elongation factor
LLTVRLLATAGHVDHGKSTLVEALTGMQPDRFREERERGLTIDLGFAWFELPSGQRVAIVDVPGHIRFIKNLLAGVGAVEGALFVVSALEGWMPQSEEHLRILEYVGIDAGVAVITNAGRAGAGLAALAQIEVTDRLARSSLAGAPVLVVDSVDRTGLAAVAAALDDLFRHRPAPSDLGRPRLWVDRSFTVRGSGTVVTGTLIGGALESGGDVEVVAAERARRAAPSSWSRAATIRAVHALGEPVERAGPGSRTALNLRRIERADTGRGDAVVLPGQWHPCRRFDAALTVAPDHPAPVSRRGAYLAYLGSGEHAVRLEIIGARRIEPGERGSVRVALPTELPLLPGDRFVLRDAGRNVTVGGGEILDVEPVLPLSRARPSRSVDRIVEERGWIRVDALERLTGERRSPTVAEWVCDPPALAATRRRIAESVDAAGALGLDLAVLDERERAALATVPDLAIIDGRVRPLGAADPLDDHPWLAALRAAPFQPPEPAGVPRAEVAALVRRGAVVDVDGVYFAAEAIDDVVSRVAAALASEPAGITLATLRDHLGTSRKYAVALAAVLDQRGFTVRRGDVRIAGPRLSRGKPGGS